MIAWLVVIGAFLFLWRLCYAGLAAVDRWATRELHRVMTAPLVLEAEQAEEQAIATARYLFAMRGSDD